MVVYGKRVVEYIVKKHPNIVKELLISKKLNKNELKDLKKFKINFIDNKTAQKISRNQNHQGYFAKIDFELKEYPIDGDTILILDEITDMGNIGAIIRTAYALGIDLIIITGIKELKLAQIIRTSSGSAIDMPIIVKQNILDVINILKTKNYKIVAADINGQSSINKDKKIALILGNEHRGIKKRVKEKVDEIITIPLKRDFDSLNVSVAGAILMDRILNGC